MPSLTYTALRSIERTTFSVSAKTTIAATSAGSPNVSTFTDSASPGNLKGVTNNQWIYIVTPLNTGWHQVIGTSTAGLITVASILTVEAAGSPVTILGYLRGFNQSYSIDVSFTNDDRQRLVTKNVSKALDGSIETLTHRRETYYNITSSAMDTLDADYPQFIEFVDSCESGENFIFDRDGSIAVPLNAISATIEGTGYTEQRLPNITGRRISARIRT